MTEIVPPYHSGNQYFNCNNSGDGDAEFHCEGNTASADRISGAIDTYNENIIWWPGDDAWQKTRTQAVMNMYFPSPVSGRLRIVANLVCGDSYYYTEVDDESGWSDNTIKQLSELIIFVGRLSDTNSIRYTFVDFHTTFPEGEWRSNMAEPGEVKLFEFDSSSTHTVGQWVNVGIIIDDYQFIKVDDMQVYAEIKHNWIIRKLDITGV